MNDITAPGSFNIFLKKQIISPMRWVRFAIAGVVLVFVYRETGVATVIVLALVTVAFELVDIAQKWTNEVNRAAVLKLQSHVVGLYTMMENLVDALNRRRGGENGGNETGPSRNRGLKN